jgi:hypothetical protein
MTILQKPLQSGEQGADTAPFSRSGDSKPVSDEPTGLEVEQWLPPKQPS